MGYRWKPNAAQRKAFAANMQNPDFVAEREAKQREAKEKRQKQSRFSYETAGGMYKPTRMQHDVALRIMQTANTTEEQEESAQMVMCAFISNMKVKHDHIHVVNEFSRKNATK